MEGMGEKKLFLKSGKRQKAPLEESVLTHFDGDCRLGKLVGGILGA